MNGPPTSASNNESSLSGLVRNALELPPFWPAQRVRLQQLANDEIGRVRLAAEETGFSALELANSGTLQRISEQKRVFILGSGASVLDLSPSQFAEMSAFPTLGFGAWPLHSFVPSAIALGPTRGLSDYTKVFTEVMKREDIIASAPEVFLLRSSLPEDLDMFSKLPHEHWARTRIYGRISPVSRSVPGLRRELKHILGSRNKQPLGITFDSGSTLVRLMTLAARSGASKIVLVGVDMNTPEYFWEREPGFLSVNGFDSFDTGQLGSVHDTLLTTRRTFAVTDVMREAAATLKQLTGGTLYIGSATSALAEFLPTYPWDSANN